MTSFAARIAMCLAMVLIPATLIPGVASGQSMESLAPPMTQAALSLKPGQFLWDDDATIAGPLSIVVSIRQQRAYVYSGAAIVAVSAVSTGKPGHLTPVGTYTILQKRAEHFSNLYENAPMPYMQRLTWDGIALHAGQDPGFPNSHGCIRLPLAFAQKLFSATRLGQAVIVTEYDIDPPFLLTDNRIFQMEERRHHVAPVRYASAQMPRRGRQATPRLSVDQDVFFWF